MKKFLVLICIGFFLTALNVGSAFGATDCSTWPTALPQPAGAPGIPANVAATGGDGQATVTWDAASGADGYYVLYTDCSAATPSSVWNLPYETVTTNSATITGLTNDTAYQFKVVSYAGSGKAEVDSTESAVAEATPTAAGATTTTTTTPATTTTTTPATTTTTGAVTTTTTPATTTTTSTTTTTTTSTTTLPALPVCADMSGYTFDVNGDGEVNALDAALIMRYINEQCSGQ